MGICRPVSIQESGSGKLTSKDPHPSLRFASFLEKLCMRTDTRKIDLFLHFLIDHQKIAADMKLPIFAPLALKRMISCLEWQRLFFEQISQIQNISGIMFVGKMQRTQIFFKNFRDF